MEKTFAILVLITLLLAGCSNAELITDDVVHRDINDSYYQIEQSSNYGSNTTYTHSIISEKKAT